MLRTRRGDLPLPAFLPDGTRGVVRTLDAEDVAATGIRALMVNVLHLSSHPGTSAIAKMGGIHRFMGCDLTIASDSGGFQAYSLVAGSRKLGSISDHGFTYRLDKSQDKKILSPEKCIQKQFQLGADIMFCLDHCTHPGADARAQRESVDHTIAWARRCKDEFARRAGECEEARPLLFAVVQGGADAALRRECIDRLLEIGFDGYGFGGWPIDDTGKLVDMVGRVAEWIPPEFPKHALGIGNPDNVARAYALGYRLFDCALPTRDARHKRLYTLGGRKTGSSFRYLYMQDEKHARVEVPLEDDCDCLCCRRYSRAYLYHLFLIDDPLALRLATIHNLRFYARLMNRISSAECKV